MLLANESHTSRPGKLRLVLLDEDAVNRIGSIELLMWADCQRQLFPLGNDAMIRIGSTLPKP